MGDRISRRQLLAVASSSTVALGTGSSTARAAQTSETILEESFEHAAEQTRPSDWTKSGTGAALVVVPDGGNSIDGEKIFGMFGSDNSCSSVGVSHALDLEGRTKARIQAYVFPTNRGQDGCTSRRAELSLQTPEGDTVSLLELTTEGTVHGPGSESLGEYGVRTWNELVVEYERSGESVTLTYTINGDSRGTISKSRHPEENSLSQFRLETGVDIVWWDALEVIASEKTSTPTPDGSGEGGGSEAGNSGSDRLESRDGSTVPGFGVFNIFLGAAGVLAAVIFLLVASLAGSGTSSGSNTGSARHLTEDEVRDGLEETEESLRDRRR